MQPPPFLLFLICLPLSELEIRPLMVLAFSESGGGWEGTRSLLANPSMTQYSEPGCCQQCVLVASGEVLELLVGTSACPLI